MNAERELLRAYSDWRRLAEAETKAIQTQNWSLLADCQYAIQDFQKLVSRLTLDARDEGKRSGEDRPTKEKQIQSLVNELIAITRQNHALLAAARQTAATKLVELKAAGINLKRLQRSYVHNEAALQAA